MSGSATFQLVFLPLLLFVVIFGLVAKKIRISYPIVMVIGGLLLSFIPGLPRVPLDPDLIFIAVLPPLLFAAAANTSWRDFRNNLTGILLLAFGLVGFLVITVAIVVPRFLSGFDFSTALALGAIVATTDAIAATSILRVIGLPARITHILEGESLINDATGLLALEAAIGIVMHGSKPTLIGQVSTIVWLTLGGIVTGLLIGWLVELIERKIEDGPIEIAISLLTPYAAYMLAELIHASGVLAVVAAGLFLARRSSNFLSPTVRIQIRSVWESLNFILNGLVFAMIGLQLPTVHDAIRNYSPYSLIVDGALFSAMLILFRLIWVYPNAAIIYVIRTVICRLNEPFPSGRQLFIVGWTGMRGVVSLAAALALPAAFPQKNMIVFLTFCVIGATVLLQGLTLRPLVRLLGLAGTFVSYDEEREARQRMIEDAMTYLEAEQKREAAPGTLLDDLLLQYRRRLASLKPGEINPSDADRHSRDNQLLLATLRIERSTALRLRNEGRINDEVLRRLEHELDLEELRLDLHK